MKVAFQGRPGAYSESAALRLLGNSIEIFPKSNFRSVFEAVQNHQVDVGILPVENSTTGSILENFDLLLEYKIPIQSEIKLQIRHCLMALPGTKIQDLSAVMSHPQALSQCSHFFEKNHSIEAVASFDTAGSAEIISQKNMSHIGALAGSLAAKEYGLTILQENVQNQENENFTRFLCISKHELSNSPNTVPLKTTLAFAPLKNEAGSLHSALGIFAKYGLSLLKIESRPVPGSPWKYFFNMEFDGSIQNKNGQKALEELKQIASWVQVLGCYPIGRDDQPIQSR